MNSVIKEIRFESKKSIEQFEKITNEQNRKMTDMQAVLTRLEGILTTLDVSYKKKVQSSV